MTDGTDRKQRALVTGASGGIGEAFARRLAGDGYDVIVVARSGDKLEALATELRDAHSNDVEVIPADLTTADGLSRVEARLKADPPIDLLINNAGFGTYGLFTELPVDREDEEVRLNILALVRLSHAVLPGLIARRRGGIINVSSVSGFQPIPRNATYSASKAFVTTFSEALHEEARPHGVTVQALCPGFTRTNFQDTAGVAKSRVPSRAWLEADRVVDDSLEALRKRRALCVPGIHYKVLSASPRFVPRVVVRRIGGLAGNRMSTPEDAGG